MERLIEFLKNKRKQQHIQSQYTGKYAFVGMGNHSIHNLYPVLDFLRIDLKYIVTKSTKNAQLIDTHFPHSTGTNDFDHVLKDSEISGVFICTQAKHHFQLVKQALEAGKNVFVEKPPCLTESELNQLIAIEKKSTASCLVGFQKRYAPANLKLKDNLKNVHSYNYKYLTGSYPEGDPIIDLFIHPIDFVSYAFGAGEINSVVTKKEGNGQISLFIHLTHQNGSIGSLELSSNYSWKNPSEQLSVNTKKGIFTVINSNELSFEAKDGLILGLPKEKIFKNNRQIVKLQERSDFSPIFENNQLYTSGYFDEVKNFISFCELNKKNNFSSLPSLSDTYKLLTQIQRHV